MQLSEESRLYNGRFKLSAAETLPKHNKMNRKRYALPDLSDIDDMEEVTPEEVTDSDIVESDN